MRTSEQTEKGCVFFAHSAFSLLDNVTLLKQGSKNMAASNLRATFFYSMSLILGTCIYIHF